MMGEKNLLRIQIENFPQFARHKLTKIYRVVICFNRFLDPLDIERILSNVISSVLAN